MRTLLVVSICAGIFSLGTYYGGQYAHDPTKVCPTMEPLLRTIEMSWFDQKRWYVEPAPVRRASPVRSRKPATS